jgi:ATP-binding cassette, subfamily B, vacuolar membrane transporter HMT1/ACLQ
MSISTARFSLGTSRQILAYTKISSPAILLVVFLAAFITHGIITAPPGDDVEVHARLGPGGRPLPKRRQSSQQVKEAAKVRDFSQNVKLLFNWLGLFALLTFAVDAILIVLQSIIYRHDQWWPGQAAVVSNHNLAVLEVADHTSRFMLRHRSSCGASF